MQSELAIHLNVFLAPVAGLVLMALDSRRMRNADETARRFLVFGFFAVLAAIFAELGYDAAVEYGGGEPGILVRATSALHIMARSCAFGFMVLFLECGITHGRSNLKKTKFFVAAFWGITIVMLFFDMIPANAAAVAPAVIHRSVPLLFFHILRCAAGCLVLASALFRHEQMNRELRVLSVISIFPVILGEVLDGFVPGAHTDNSLLFVSALFAYLFIVRRNALADALTGVHNRRGCDEYLLALAREKRSRDHAFIMIDMDRFKEINDTFGHAQGDSALRDAADILRSSVRGTDFVARYGGDEFVIIAAGNDPEAVTRHITESIAKFNAKRLRPYTLSLSFGCGVHRPDDGRTPQEFLSHVDALMYAQKNERRKNPR